MKLKFKTRKTEDTAWACAMGLRDYGYIVKVEEKRPGKWRIYYW